MHDHIEIIGNSLVQHGPNNDRVYLMKLEVSDLPAIIDQMHDLTIFKGYTKIFAKIPEEVKEIFIDQGYRTEAVIPGFFNASKSACFVSRFYGESRAYLSPEDKSIIEKNIDIALHKKNPPGLALDCGIDIRELGPESARTLANLYKKIFRVYPFPIFDESFIENAMRRDTIFFGAIVDNRLIAASSAEADLQGANAEMTDFATLPDFRGKNLSLFLLRKMEEAMKKRTIGTVFTIARSLSVGMNVTFARSGYHFAGTLVNNTLIGKKIESMNVWYKHL